MELRQARKRLGARAKAKDLRTHDLRHETPSRFSETGVSMPVLASISGHKNVLMLSRYTHIQPTQLARRLAWVMRMP